MRAVLLTIMLLEASMTLSAASPTLRQNKPSLRAATPNQTTMPRYGKLELTLDLTATFDNPFDPEDVDVYAVFTAPNGRSVRVNGFLYQPFTRRLEKGAEKIEPAGEPVWKVRFASDAVGEWRYRVFAKDGTGNVSLPEARFQVTASTNPGFIRRSATNPRAFAYDNGQPFFAVGENMCWGGGRGSFDYDDWLSALGRAGGNWIRIWMSSWNCALEWSREGKGDWRNGSYYGVGFYSLGNAWKLDTILDAAERNGVSVMLCFGTYGEFTEGGYFNEGQWKANPYNAANGGPCAKPDEFWTNEQARKLYRRRLRYVAARCGYRTNVHSWEFWNEANAPAAWVAEMARCLKGTGEFQGQAADPYGHLVTTTYGDADVWKIPEIDFTQTHSYGTGNFPDHAPVIHNDALRNGTASVPYGKPHLMGEFGIDWRSADSKYDPEGKGINLHNGLWSSAVSGNAGGAMIWYWDGYVHPRNLYGQFTPLRKFADAVPWAEREWKPLDMDSPRVTDGAEGFRDMVLMATSGWGRCAVTEFTVTPDRGVGNVTLPSFLYSPAKPDLRTTPTFRVNFERSGRFVLRVDTVSASARLRFILDDKLAREVMLSAEPPKDPGVKPEYEKTDFRKEYGIYQARFNKDYGIDVPAGAHAIRLEVTEGDWVSVETYTLTGYTSSRFPRINLYGMTNGQMAVLWAQNADHHWKNVSEKKPIPVIQRAETVVRGLPSGRYTVEWWDTYKGEVTKRESIVCANGALRLRLPDLETDVAARLVLEAMRR